MDSADSIPPEMWDGMDALDRTPFLTYLALAVLGFIGAIIAVYASQSRHQQPPADLHVAICSALAVCALPPASQEVGKALHHRHGGRAGLATTTTPVLVR
jgi:hypothetical protein